MHVVILYLFVTAEVNNQQVCVPYE